MYTITKDDYNYFNRLIITDLGGQFIRGELVKKLRNHKEKFIENALLIAKFHWQLGDGELKDFPKNEFNNVINQVISQIINDYESV